MVAAFLVIAFFLVAFAGLMAAVESAMSSLSRADVSDLAESGIYRRSLLAIAAETGAHAHAIGFARIVAETTAAVLVTTAFLFAFDEIWVGLLLSALVMTGASFVLVGASPRSVGRVHARTVLRLSALLVHFLRVLLGPIANVLTAIGDRVTPGRSRSAAFSSEEQLLSFVDEAAELDVLEEDDRELIHSVIEFNDTVVREVMVPRIDMVVVEAEATLDGTMAQFFRRGVSRVPVVDGEIDDVVGVLYLRDVSRTVWEQPDQIDAVTARDLARQPLFVPESMKADALLHRMQREQNHLALVVDEYGGIAGLATLEDLIEELVGEISDEYDRATVEIEQLEDGRVRVSARLAIPELAELFEVTIDEEDVDTVGGLFAKALGRLPVTGSVARTHGLVLTAERTEGRRKRLVRVLVEREEQAADTEEDADG